MNGADEGGVNDKTAVGEQSSGQFDVRFARLLLRSVVQGAKAAPVRVEDRAGVAAPASEHSDTPPSLWRVVDVANCQVGNVGVHLLCSYLSSDEVEGVKVGVLGDTQAPLYLSLRNNEIGDEGAIILARLLSANTAIGGLDLRDNHIGLPGANAIAMAIRARRFALGGGSGGASMEGGDTAADLLLTLTSPTGSGGGGSGGAGDDRESSSTMIPVTTLRMAGNYVTRDQLVQVLGGDADGEAERLLGPQHQASGEAIISGQ